MNPHGIELQELIQGRLDRHFDEGEPAEKIVGECYASALWAMQATEADDPWYWPTVASAHIACAAVLLGDRDKTVELLAAVTRLAYWPR